MSDNDLKKIGKVEEFPEKQGVPIEIDGISIAIFKINGNFYGIQNLCPHRRLPLHRAGHPRAKHVEETHESKVDITKSCNSSECGASDDDISHFLKSEDDYSIIGKVNGENLTIRCPWHRMLFELETGRIPARNMNIATYEVEAEGGEVYLRI